MKGFRPATQPAPAHPPPRQKNAPSERVVLLRGIFSMSATFMRASPAK
jgi:hypothetical protein